MHVVRHGVTVGRIGCEDLERSDVELASLVSNILTTQLVATHDKYAAIGLRAQQPKFQMQPAIAELPLGDQRA